MPPWTSMSLRRASAIAWEPPSATTHPLARAAPPASARRRSSSDGRVGRRHARRCPPRAPSPGRSATLEPPSRPASSRPHRTARTSADGAAHATPAAMRRRTTRRNVPPSVRTTGAIAGRRPAICGRCDRSIGTARRRNRRRAGGHSRPTVVATELRRAASCSGTVTRPRSGAPPSNGRASIPARSSRSCARRRRSCRWPRAPSRRGRPAPAVPPRRVRSVRCRRRSPTSSCHRSPTPDLRFDPRCRAMERPPARSRATAM